MIRPRRDGFQVIVYTGIDPVTGRQRQVKGSRKQAERVETKLKAEVLAGRHRGTAAKTLGRDGGRLPGVAGAERQAHRAAHDPGLPGARGGQDQAGPGEAAPSPGRPSGVEQQHPVSRPHHSAPTAKGDTHDQHRDAEGTLLQRPSRTPSSDHRLLGRCAVPGARSHAACDSTAERCAAPCPGGPHLP